MSIKQKILSRITAMFIVATVMIILIVSLNFREYGVNSATEKAEVMAELVKTGLTSHMVNGTMDQRDFFIDGISNLRDVEDLWVIRGENVVKQYGPPREMEKPRDKVDEAVLLTGKEQVVFEEEASRVKLRVSIPYNVTTKDRVKCITCHNAKVGETLGAVSMVFDISNVRSHGVSTIINILVTSLVAILIVLLVTNGILNPYLELFEGLKNSLRRASKGDFGGAINTSLTDEAGDMVASYDSFLEKLNNIFGEIDRKLRVFVANVEKRDDPLQESIDIVSQLSEIYNFKRAIEQDVTKEDIYQRLAEILKVRGGFINFTFSEIDQTGNELQVVFQEGKEYHCKDIICSDANKCRAKRVGKDVISTDFPHLCPSFESQEKEHLCIPINIGGNVGLVINAVFESKEELEEKRKFIHFIENFANEASPVIESKRLMKILRDSSLKDALTGLYNRRFLDEYVEKLAPQAIRHKHNVGILMIDMDYFKKVNDNYGHDIGDLVLKELSFILREGVRESDLVVRYGGEEFIIILNNIDSEDNMIAVAEKLRIAVEDKIINIGNEKTLKKTISLGASYFPKDTTSIWEAIKFADVALYQAKHTGRNKVVRFTPDLWTGESFNAV
ncbi:MAG: GGDEF domain-containing protein [Campylobacterales bacterium]|nr:GGDEF domain-containing protein [Campylobacterales bacterium]